jgi:hypothetical protein
MLRELRNRTIHGAAALFLLLGAGEMATAQTYVLVTPAASGVTASTNDGNVPGNTVDNSLSTRWSANGDGQWIKLDLGSSKTVGYVTIGFYSGNTRSAYFDLQISSDNTNWTNVSTGLQSNGTTTQQVTFDFPDVTARYVRYLGHGNSVNGWNSLAEVDVYALSAPTPTPTPRPTATPSGPTAGWTQTSFTYTVQKPYDLNVSDRFKYVSGVWYCWVYKTDKPHSTTSATDPRTEMRWQVDYTSGQHMWDGDVYPVSGIDDAHIQQVFGGVTNATASMVMAFADGTLRRYDTNVIATGALDKWTNIKNAHDADANQVRIYVNNVLMRTDPDRGDTTHYLKNGVYGTASTRSECRFRNLKYWRR